jgi:hypothetical protein
MQPLCPERLTTATLSYVVGWLTDDQRRPSVAILIAKTASTAPIKQRCANTNAGLRVSIITTEAADRTIDVLTTTLT